MTLGQVIRMVDGMKPNAVPDELKTQWISEVEGMVQAQVMLVLPSQIVEYQWPTDQDKELLVGAPHSKIYWSYLAAMIDFANQEFDLYANSMQMFNAHWSEFQRWFLRMYHPADEHEEQYQNETPETIGVYWRGYFLTAYGIAVKHGFRGTEQQWLESLIGAPGKSAMMRLENGKIQWRLEDEELWQDLLDASSVEHDRITAQTAAEEAAASAQNAGSAMGEAGNSAAQAQSAMTRAGQSEQNAQQAAQTATQNASAAAESAKSAATAQSHAEMAEQRASESARSAASSESHAGMAEQRAADWAQDAQSASTAAAKAQAAAEASAQTAETAKSAAELSAQNAQRAAQTATQDASAAAESARSASSAESHAGMAEQRAADWAQDAESASTAAESARTAAEAAALRAENAAGNAEHPNRTDNPHHVTAQQIGAAPAGYGLGGASSAVDSWHNATENGFYKSNKGTPDGDGNYWHGIVVNYSGVLCSQLVWKTWGTGSVMATRRINNSIPEEWEWINPPMDAGVVYRTTRRYLGKPVYTKLIDCGTLPHNSRKNVSYGNTDPGGVGTGTPIVVIEVVAGTNDGASFPRFSGAGNTPNFTISTYSGEMQIITSGMSGASSSKVYAQIWYTK